MSTAWRNRSTSRPPSSRANFIRLSDARLHAESSMNMYSEQGFDALMRWVALHGFHLLIVVSYWIPGSPQTQADRAILRKSARASNVPIGSPVVTAYVVCVPPPSTARMNSSVTRTEWFAFWKPMLL
jgi:hypothetical protein